MTHIFRPASRDELITLSRQLRAAYSTMANPNHADVVINTDTSGPVQAVIVTDALYAAWEAAYGAVAEPAIEPETPPVRVETAAADGEKPKRRRTPKKSTKTDSTRGA